MKKILSLLIVIVMCLSLCACGKSAAAKECEKLIKAIGNVSVDSKEAVEAAEKAYATLTDEEKKSISDGLSVLEEAQKTYIHALSKEVYQNLTSAHTIINEFGRDLADAWWIVIFDEDKLVNNNTLNVLVSELNYLDEASIKAGIAYVMAHNYDRKNWEELSDTEKDAYTEAAEAFTGKEFDVFDNRMNVTLYIVRNAYTQNGSVDTARDYLERAKMQIQELREKSSDSAHYSELKGLYTTVCAYLDACLLGQQSYETFTEAKAEYEKDIRDYTNTLDLLLN